MNLRSSQVRRLAAALLSVSMLLPSCSSASPTAAPTRAPKATQAAAAPTANAEATQVAPIPVFAYYYIWFDPTSWDKYKLDYPLLGHYSSDDATVMRKHIEWAKAARIQAFIVSWKSTDRLNQRLAQLVQTAKSENFKLAINYEGFDQQRTPLPVAQVASDFDYFIAHYADEPVFKIYDKPMMVWAGSWKFSTTDIASVTQGRRDKLLILASDRDAAGIQRLNGMIDGDAYYFSSVNPETFPNYQAKLDAMSKAVHYQRGLWIAPAAPGFDARDIGGTTVVDRKDGATLQAEMNVAWRSSPDAIGLISWNEFTENSYIEPSEKYGHKYLDMLDTIGKTQVPQISNLMMDSSDPGTGSEDFPMKAVALGMIGTIILVSFVMIARRR